MGSSTEYLACCQDGDVKCLPVSSTEYLACCQDGDVKCLNGVFY